MSKIKKTLSGSLITLIRDLLFLLLLSLIFLYFSTQIKPKSLIEFQARSLIIEKGTSLLLIAEKLQEAGMITNPHSFLLLAKVTGLDKKIQAGRYCFTRPMSSWEILSNLKQGGTLTEEITIPEGYTLREIARLLQNQVSIDSLEFLKWCYDTTFCLKLGIPVNNLEGYLFPNSYNIYWKMEAKKAIELMVAEFNNIYNDSLTKRAEELGFTRHQIITLASLIEKEAKIDSERLLISAVFHNRLRLGRPLESCATIEYLLPEHKERLLYKDLKIKSPYNTYLNLGLPPGPICNPGKKSIESALYPAKVDYLYFVSNSDGSHTFSRTGIEHIQAKHRR
ncbi:MAG: endolytic transglycosylase MltG [Candidatus Edwardsbacteria bacterium]